jgi:DNA-binding XRE family transcriptional regulator
VTGRRIPVDDTLRVRCWCRRADVAVPAAEVKAGLTRSCGTPACTKLAVTFEELRHPPLDPRIVRRLAQTVEVLDQLGAVVAIERRSRDLGMTRAARQIGISERTLRALEKDRTKTGTSLHVARLVIAWLIDRDHRAGL